MNDWLAVYTKPRSEKKAHDSLMTRGIEVYCPMSRTLRQWSDRKKLVTVPLFPSYLFVRVNITQRNLVLQDSRVIQYVHWLGKPAIIRDCEIEAIREFLEEFPEPKLESISINLGDIVEVVAGPLKNYRGVILDVKRHKAILKLDSIGFQLTAEVPKSKLMVLHE